MKLVPWQVSFTSEESEAMKKCKQLRRENICSVNKEEKSVVGDSSLSLVSLQLVTETNLFISPTLSLLRSHTLALQPSALPTLPCCRSHTSVLDLYDSCIVHSTSLPIAKVEVLVQE